jgi:Holliday junction resolvase RusA-like endonuclease
VTAQTFEDAHHAAGLSDKYEVTIKLRFPKKRADNGRPVTRNDVDAMLAQAVDDLIGGPDEARMAGIEIETEVRE